MKQQIEDSNDEIRSLDLNDLENKNIKGGVEMMVCDAGNLQYPDGRNMGDNQTLYNMAQAISDKTNGAPVIAIDGGVKGGYSEERWWQKKIHVNENYRWIYESRGNAY